MIQFMLFCYGSSANHIQEKEEYFKSIQYSRAAIGVISNKAWREPNNPVSLIRNYFNLSDGYGALNKTSEQINALDSCLLLSVTLKRFDEFYLYALWEKANFLFDIGDYQRSLGYVKMSNMAPAGLLHNENDYHNLFLNIHVNALLGMRKYDSAEKLLSEQLADKQQFSKNYLGRTICANGRN